MPTSNTTTLPLKAIRDIEPYKSWSEVKTPNDLILYIVANFVVDPSALSAFQQFIYSSSQPTGIDAGKPWVKTDSPPGFGVPIGENYILLTQYPPDVPLIWTKDTALPSYLRKLTEDEMTDYALATPTRGYYFIYET